LQILTKVDMIFLERVSVPVEVTDRMSRRERGVACRGVAWRGLGVGVVADCRVWASPAAGPQLEPALARVPTVHEAELIPFAVRPLNSPHHPLKTTDRCKWRLRPLSSACLIWSSSLGFVQPPVRLTRSHQQTRPYVVPHHLAKAASQASS